jgi:hypothetical protein
MPVKRSSLFQKLISYVRKKIFIIGPREFVTAGKCFIVQSLGQIVATTSTALAAVIKTFYGRKNVFALVR